MLRPPILAACVSLALLLIVGSPVRADDEPAPPPAAEAAPAQPKAPAKLDLVTLEGGNQVEGRIESVTDQGVTIRITSARGGTSKVTLPRARVRKIEYGGARPAGVPVDGAGTAPAREDWFLLRTDGRIVGVRRIALWGAGHGEESGWRIEETLDYFDQGPHVPALSVRRVEETDEAFILRSSLFSEQGHAARAVGGPEPFRQSATGRVDGGLWKGRLSQGTVKTTREILLPSDARGPLGYREHILRATRAIGMHEAHVLDGATGELVAVRAGFVGLQQRPRAAPGAPPASPRDELHWEARGTRLISWFGQGVRVVRETIAEGVTAVPVSAAAAKAALENADLRARDPTQHAIRLPEAGISFELPDPSWIWVPQTAAPVNTGWRKLGRLEAPVYAADVRVELHPEGAVLAPGMETGAAWLRERLGSVCKDLRLAQKPQPLKGLAGAWRVGYTGTLKGESIYTLAVVVDRGDSRTVLLIACPKAAWEDARETLERFIASVNLL